SATYRQLQRSTQQKKELLNGSPQLIPPSAHDLLSFPLHVCFSNLVICYCKEEFAKMRRRIEGFMVLAALLLLIAGCDNTANTNNRAANANANANANTNTVATSTPVPTANNNRAPTREEYERNKERYNREAKESGRTIGT